MEIKLNLSGHENEHLTKLGFTFPGALHVDLADPELPNKVVEFLKKECGLSSGDTVIIAPPGLAFLAVLTIAAIHGLTGTFPSIIPLIRSKEGFVPGEEIPLQDFRNDIARSSRENIVEL